MYSFLKHYGYIWETGNTGHYTYGPYGKQLKNKIEKFLRYKFDKLDFLEIETPLIYRKKTWKKSGHWNKFQDPIIKTKKNKVHRLDHVIERHYPDLDKDFSELSVKEINEMLEKLNLKIIENSKGDPFLIKDKIDSRNLMLVTYSGGHESALRPETATATYQQFKELYDFNKQQFPVKVFQIGKSFRNEISCRNGILRSREFTQAEFHIILKKDMKNHRQLDLGGFIEKIGDEIINIVDKDTDLGYRKELLRNITFSSVCFQEIIYFVYMIFKELGFSLDNMRLRKQGDDERAFYALDAWDIEVYLRDIGWTEICGIHDRGSYDLRQYGKKAPDILEIAFGIDRLFYSILDISYENKTKDEGKTILKLPLTICPIEIGLFPLKNDIQMIEKCSEIRDFLRDSYKIFYSSKYSIGKRYLQANIQGIPFCITVDDLTLQDNSVTVRNRDTEIQERVSVYELLIYFGEKFRYD